MSLDMDSPEALFGADACLSKGALRRAYAKLIRVHRPERDPERFAQIRRLYERALAALQQSKGPRPAPLEDPVRGPEAKVVEAQLAELTAETLPETRASLEARALEGCTHAAIAAFAAREAAAPRTTVAWLETLFGDRDLRALALELAATLLRNHPEQARCPDWEGVLIARAPTQRAGLVCMLAAAHLQLGDAGGAAELLFGNESLLCEQTPPRWPELLETVLGAAVPLPQEALARHARRIEGGLLDEEAALRLLDALEHRVALCDAEKDPGISRGLWRLLSLPVVAEGLQSSTRALADYVSEALDLPGELARLREHHPTLFAHLHRHLELTSRRCAAWSGRFEGTLPSIPAGLHEALAERARQQGSRPARVTEAPEEPLPRPELVADEPRRGAWLLPALVFLASPAAWLLLREDLRVPGVGAWAAAGFAGLLATVVRSTTDRVLLIGVERGGWAVGLFILATNEAIRGGTLAPIIGFTLGCAAACWSAGTLNFHRRLRHAIGARDARAAFSRLGALQSRSEFLDLELARLMRREGWFLHEVAVAAEDTNHPGLNAAVESLAQVPFIDLRVFGEAHVRRSWSVES